MQSKANGRSIAAHVNTTTDDCDKIKEIALVSVSVCMWGKKFCGW